MTHASIFGELNAQRWSRSAAVFVLAAALFGVFGGCDAVEPRSDDTDVRSSGPNEVQIESESFTRADLQFDPVSVSPGKTFSIELMDDEIGQDVTRITHEGTSDGSHLLRAQFDPLKPTAVSVRCRNQNEGTQRTMATFGSAKLKSGDTGGAREVARTDSTEVSSYHYIDDGETVIVEVDYGGGSTGGLRPGVFKFPSSDQPVQCTHVGFVLENVSTPLSADGIRFRGGDRAPSFQRKHLR